MEVTPTESVFDRAEKLLREDFAPDGGTSRHNTLLGRGGGGQPGLEKRQRWAEAWQLLERAGLICRSPDESPGTDWFLTASGRTALSGGDIMGSIELSGIRP
jgi:hypothetical protein